MTPTFFWMGESLPNFQNVGNLTGSQFFRRGYLGKKGVNIFRGCIFT